ncbi:2Fe-2S iron-sulfur cluster-binding protein [Natrinema ejinorense]|uniref:Ferredoxin n=1 Tax=Natrinema ejinorense TaxID=373386 RepID=A0A2A5QWW1_9EURY|nr:2Fe-2S iron-sulfur cluster-binding protein [Natrinema ejinorense]PCR91336.1 ferredoxin [Natrinema ejinorense]
MYDVTFSLEEGAETVAVAPDESVLDAAERAGLDLPHSCRNGMCTACAGELLSGELESNGTALSPEQEADGYVLLCCSSPRTDCVIRVGERVQDELLGLDAF